MTAALRAKCSAKKDQNIDNNWGGLELMLRGFCGGVEWVCYKALFIIKMLTLSIVLGLGFLCLFGLLPEAVALYTLPRTSRN